MSCASAPAKGSTRSATLQSSKARIDYIRLEGKAAPHCSLVPSNLLLLVGQMDAGA
jgi:hypothetical protein